MKNIKLLIISLVASGLFITGAQAAEKGDKIGYLDLSRIFDEYQKTKDYDKVLEAKSAEYEKERNAKIEKVRDAQNKLGLLAQDKKADQEKEIEKMKAELLEYDRQKKGDLTKERNEKIREILLEIEKIVSNFAQKENYSLILNDRVLIYGNPAMNVTEQILKAMSDSKADDKKSDKK